MVDELRAFQIDINNQFTQYDFKYEKWKSINFFGEFIDLVILKSLSLDSWLMGASFEMCNLIE